MTEKTLYLMLGYPGAGKTTAARLIHKITGAIHLWADDERRQKFTSPKYDHKENVILYKQLNKTAEDLLSQGKSVVFDTNFNFYSDRENLRSIAKKVGAETIIIWVTTPKEIARSRATDNAHLQETRVLGDMPHETFDRMSRNLEPPHEGEAYLEIDGTKIDLEHIQQILNSRK